MNIENLSLKETLDTDNMTETFENLMHSTATISLGDTSDLENVLKNWKTASSSIRLAAPEQTSLELLGKSLPLSAVMPTETTD